MPQIPRETTPKVVPLPEMAPGIAGAPGQAIARAGQGVASTSSYLVTVESMIRQAQDAVTTLRAENEIIRDINQHAQKFEMRNDYANFSGDMDRVEESIKSQYSAAYSGNPRVWAAVGPYLDRQVMGLRRAVHTKEVALTVEDGKYQLQIAKEEALERAATVGTNSDAWREVADDFYLKTYAAVSRHIISAGEGEKLRKDFEMRAEKAEVVRKIGSPNPDIIQQGLDDINAHKFSRTEGNDPQWLMMEKERGERRLEIASARRESRQREVMVDRAMNDLKSAFGTDYDKMFGALRSPKFATAMELDSKGVQEVENRLATEERHYHDGIKQQEEEKERKIQKGISLGKDEEGNPFTVESMRKIGLLDAHKEEYWENELARKSKRSDEDISNSEDVAGWVKISSMIDAGYGRKEIMQVLATTPLKRATAEKAWDQLRNREDKEVDAGQKWANDEIRDAISPSRGALPQSSAAMLRANGAMAELDDWVRYQKKMEVAQQRERLTAREIRDKALEIIPKYRMTPKAYIDSLREEMAMQPMPDVMKPSSMRPGGALPVPTPILPPVVPETRKRMGKQEVSGAPPRHEGATTPPVKAEPSTEEKQTTISPSGPEGARESTKLPDYSKPMVGYEPGSDVRAAEMAAGITRKSDRISEMLAGYVKEGKVPTEEEALRDYIGELFTIYRSQTPKLVVNERYIDQYGRIVEFKGWDENGEEKWLILTPQ